MQKAIANAQTPQMRTQASLRVNKKPPFGVMDFLCSEVIITPSRQNVNYILQKVKPKEKKRSKEMIETKRNTMYNIEC